MRPWTFVVLSVLAAVPLFATEGPRVGETIDVSIVNVDAVVTDKQGNRVRGLTRDDFEIFENGKLQPITNFTEVGAGQAPSPDQRHDVLFVLDAHFSEKIDVAALRQSAKFLVVISWDANHPLAEAADVLLPGTIHAEKEGTFTNLQNRVQRIHQAFAPKGQAVSELELFRRLGALLYPDADEFRSADTYDIFAALRETMPAMAEAL